MALTDLANIDLLDAVLAHHLTDEQREDFLNVYLQSYATAVGVGLSGQLKPADDEAMKKLLAEPDLTPEKLDQFYIDRIPDFKVKMEALTLVFKKRFILDVYKNKVEEYKTSGKTEGLAAWEQIYADAQADNWNEVARYLRIVDGMGAKPAAPPPPPPATP